MSSNREFILTIWKLQPGTERVHTSVFALHTSNDHPSSKSTKRFNDAKSSSSAMHANSSISLEKFLYLYFMLCCVVLVFCWVCRWVYKHSPSVSVRFFLLFLWRYDAKVDCIHQFNHFTACCVCSFLYCANMVMVMKFNSLSLTHSTLVVYYFVFFFPPHSHSYWLF